MRLHIVGSHAGDDIRALASSDVIFHGYVSDLELAQKYAEAGLAIAPLRYGGGMKGKVLEAMAAGVPLVSTTVGVQGAPMLKRSHIVADDAQEFADKIERALSHPKEALLRARGAVEFIRQHHSVQAVRERLSVHMPELSAHQRRLQARWFDGRPSGALRIEAGLPVHQAG